MPLARTRACRVLNWRILATAGLLALAGCRAAADAAATGLLGENGQVQTFITDFARQALAAFVL